MKDSLETRLKGYRAQGLPQYQAYQLAVRDEEDDDPSLLERARAGIRGLPGYERARDLAYGITGFVQDVPEMYGQFSRGVGSTLMRVPEGVARLTGYDEGADEIRAAREAAEAEYGDPETTPQAIAGMAGAVAPYFGVGAAAGGGLLRGIAADVALDAPVAASGEDASTVGMIAEHADPEGLVGRAAGAAAGSPLGRAVTEGAVSAGAGLALAEGLPRVIRGLRGMGEAGHAVSPAQAASEVPPPRPEPRLRATHNTTLEGVEFAEEMGGIPNPSLAVHRADQSFDSMGDVSLVGSRDLVDPAAPGVEVYDADIYSARTPRRMFETTPESDALLEELAAETRRMEGSSGWTSGMDELAKGEDTADVADRLSRSTPGQAAYLRAQGVELEPAMGPPRLETGDWISKLDREQFEEVASRINNTSFRSPENAAARAELGDLYRRAIDEWAAEAGWEDEIVDLYRKNERIFGEDGAAHEITIGRITRDLNKLDAGQEIDTSATRTAVREALEEHGGEKAAQRWWQDRIRSAYGEPYFETASGRKRPFELEGLSREMARQSNPRARERRMVYGPGEARAASARKLSSVEDFDDYRAGLVSSEELDEVKKAQEAVRGGVAERLVDYHPDESMWDTLDDMHRAAGRYGKGARTEAAARRALEATGFRSPDDEAVAAFKEYAESIVDAPTQYLEVKMRRAVNLDEFSGAVVPDDTPPNVIDGLKARGLEVETYPRHDDQARMDAFDRMKGGRDGLEEAGMLFVRGTGPVAGAAIGATQGDTPEERARNAMLGGIVGLGVEAAAPAAIRGLRGMGDEGFAVNPRRGQPPEDVPPFPRTREEYKAALDEGRDPIGERFVFHTTDADEMLSGVQSGAERGAVWFGHRPTGRAGNVFMVDRTKLDPDLLQPGPAGRHLVYTGSIPDDAWVKLGTVGPRSEFVPTVSRIIEAAGEMGGARLAGDVEESRLALRDPRAGAVVAEVPGSVAGGLLGASIGAGTAENEEDRGQRALVGGAIGVAGGALAGYVAQRGIRGMASDEPPTTGLRPSEKQPLVTPSQKALDEAGEVNLRNFNLDREGTQRLERHVARIIDTSRASDLGRRTVTWDETRQVANELGLSPSDLDKVAASRMTGAEMLAVRDIVAQNIDDLTKVERRLQTGLSETGMPLTRNQTEEAERLVNSLEAQNNQLLRKFLKARSESGRNLNSLKILANRSLDPVAWTAKAEKVKGGPLTEFEQRDLRRLLAKGDRLEIAKYVGGLYNAPLPEKIVTLWKAGLLSNPATHQGNIVGNFTMATLETLKDAPAALFDRVASSISGLRSKDGISADALKAGWDAVDPKAMRNVARLLVEPMAGSAAGAAAGAAVSDDDSSLPWVAGAVGGLAGFGHALSKLPSHLDDAAMLQKYDVQRQIDFDEWGRLSPFLNAYAGPNSRIFSSLTEGDKVFRNLAMARSMTEQAQVMARNEGFEKGTEEFTKRVEEIISTDAELQLRAISDAEVSTFLNKGGHTTFKGVDLAEAGERFRNALGPMAHFVIPFTRTPANIMDRVLEYSPVGFLADLPKAADWLQKIRQGKRAGGLTPQDLAELGALQREMVEQAGRATLGTLGMLAGYTLAEKGLLSGNYPSDATDRNIQDLTRQQPHSLKVGDEWLGLDRLSPLANLLTLGAEVHSMANDPELGFWGGVARTPAIIGKTVVDQSFLSGVQGALDAVSNPERSFGRWARQTAGSVVPSGIYGMTRAIDPVFRDPQTASEAVVGRIPGLSQTLTPTIDAFGEERERSTSAMGRLGSVASPFFWRESKEDDELRAEVARVGASISRYAPRGSERGTDEYAELQREYGEATREAVEQVVRSARYRNPANEVARLRRLPESEGRSDEELARQVQAELIEDAVRTARSRLTRRRSVGGGF